MRPGRAFYASPKLAMEAPAESFAYSLLLSPEFSKHDALAVGGIAHRTLHPNRNTYAGAPPMVEISRDGKRVYWTNSRYATRGKQFYPDGVPAAEVMANARPNGGLELQQDYWVNFPEYRAHQMRRDDGDCFTNSFCYPPV